MDLINKIKKNWQNFVIGILIVFVFGFMFIFSIGLSSNMVYKNDYVDSQYQTKSLSMNRMAYDLDLIETSSVDSGSGIEVRKIIKTANLDLESDEFDKTKTDIESIIKNYEVIVLNQNQYSYKQDYRRINYEFKVDSTKLEQFLEDLKKTAEVQNYNVQAEDVTKSYTDYTNRLNRYEEQITRYKEMLISNNDIEEEVEIQKRIDELEDNIFNLKNTLSQIEDKAKFSRVRVDLEEEPSVLAEINFLGFKDGFKLFMTSLESGIEFILAVFGFLLPFGVIYGGYRVTRKFVFRK